MISRLSPTSVLHYETINRVVGELITDAHWLDRVTKTSYGIAVNPDKSNLALYFGSLSVYSYLFKGVLEVAQLVKVRVYGEITIVRALLMVFSLSLDRYSE